MKKIGLYIFAIFLLAAGLMHFLSIDFFLNIMPPILPFPKAIVYITGVMEIALAVALVIPKTRKRAGVLAAIFLVLVFPANIYSAVAGIPSDTPQHLLWIRLLFQPLLIWWVLKVSR